LVKLLHLVYDEKFIDFIVDVFASIPDTISRYRVIVRDPSVPLRHIRTLGQAAVVAEDDIGSAVVRDDLEWCDGLIVHYLGVAGAKAILHAPSHVRVAWSGWGRDYYDFLPNHDGQLLDVRTRRLVASLESRAPTQRLWRLARSWRRRLVVEPLFRRAVRRVAVFSAPVEGDLSVARHAFRGALNAEYAQLSYASVERSFDSVTAESAGAIMVGNSASPTNNHADVFELIAAANLGDRAIIVPLSYGDDGYRREIIRHGQHLFGNRFVPLVDFVSLSTYNQMIAKCAVAVMGHRRQEGLGNVCTMLYAGRRVLMNPVSTIYKCLKERGAVVGTLDDLRTGADMSLLPLTDSERKVNREILIEAWGHSVVVRNARCLVERLVPQPLTKRA
jgi:hypothetical protein